MADLKLRPVRVALRSACVAVLALLGVLWLGVCSTATTALALAATTALIMGGTTHPLSVPPDTQPFVNGYVAGAQNNYIVPGGSCPLAGCPTVVAVVTPEQLVLDFGTMTLDQSVAQGLANLDGCVHGSASCVTNQAVPGTSPPPYAGPFVIYGYSQSAEIAALEKIKLAAEQSPPATSFFLIADLNRPNGGILARERGLTIPILGATFTGPAPTSTEFPTVDVARQYDGLADAPLNPLNVLADLNAGLGFYYLHSGYPDLNLGDAQLQGQFGDTTYYLITTPVLPLLMPLAQVGVPAPVLALLDAPLRVLVEAGYNRTISPGQPTTASFFYLPNPVTLAVDLVVSIPTGVDNALSAEGLGRPLHTQPAGPFGVGGPPVDPTGPSGPAPAPADSTTSHTTLVADASPVNTGTSTTNAVATTDTSTPDTNAAKTNDEQPTPTIKAPIKTTDPLTPNLNAAKTNNDQPTVGNPLSTSNALVTTTDVSTPNTNAPTNNADAPAPKATQTTYGPSSSSVTQSPKPTIRGPIGSTSVPTDPPTPIGLTKQRSAPTNGSSTENGSTSNSSQSSTNGSSSSNPSGSAK